MNPTESYWLIDDSWQRVGTGVMTQNEARTQNDHLRRRGVNRRWRRRDMVLAEEQRGGKQLVILA